MKCRYMDNRHAELIQLISDYGFARIESKGKEPTLEDPTRHTEFDKACNLWRAILDKLDDVFNVKRDNQW